MIIGFISNIAVYEAAMSCMKGVAMSSGSKIVDKIVIPAGIFILASMAGDEAQKYTETKVKETVESLKSIKKDLEDSSEETPDLVVENVFDKKEDEENGESDNA